MMNLEDNHFEVVDSMTFHYGRGKCEIWNMNLAQRQTVEDEAKKLWEGAEVFVRVSDYWCPLVSGGKYDDVWSGEIKPALGASIGGYGIVRGTHKPRDRKLALDALYEEFTKKLRKEAPHPKKCLIGASVTQALFSSVLGSSNQR